MEYEAVSPTEKLRLELSQNVDLIKIKRLCKKQSAYITSLEAQIKSLKEETDYLRSCAEISANDKENTAVQLISEKERANKLEAEVTIFKGHMDALKEQLQDLQSENAVLKVHNENLLQLSSLKDSTKNTGQRIKNLNEVEERLKMEVINSRELAGKLSESEWRVKKLEHELDKQTNLVQNLQRKTLQLKEHNTEISHQLEDTIGNKERRKHVEKINKATSTNISTYDTLTKDRNDNEKLNKMSGPLSTTDSDPVIASRLSKNENQKELHQCRHLLRIQHSLNQQYKSEIDQLQKIVQNKKFQNDSIIKDMQEIIFEHLNKLKKFKNNDIAEIYLSSTKSQLENLPLMLKQVLLYHLNILHEIINETSNEANGIRKVVDIISEELEISSNATLHRRGSYTVQPIQHCKMISSVSQANIKQEELDNQITEYEYPAKFEFSIHQAKFEQFPQHLKRYNDNPKIFLTWSFYNENDDNKQQAYTDVKSINDATFACTCEYEGYCSPGFFNYLKLEGMNIEVHLVQDEISVRIALIAVDTSQCIENINHLCNTTCEIVGDHVRGSVNCNFKLICDEKIIEHYKTS